MIQPDQYHIHLRIQLVVGHYDTIIEIVRSKKCLLKIMIPWNIIRIFLLAVFILAGCDNDEKKLPTQNRSRHKTGGNPVIVEGSADPSVRVFNDKIYIYPSHDYSVDNNFWIMKDWKAYSTEDLINITDHGAVLKGRDISWAKEPNHCWAPDCIEKNGKYYFYFSLSDVRGTWKGEIGVGIADSPVGPFKEFLGKPLISITDKPKNYENWFYNIDPAAFTDDDGRSYLFWGNGVCFMAELNDDMVSFKSEIKHIKIEDHQGYTEGPFIWKRKGIYYLLYSRTGSSGYDVLDYATSKHIDGPYIYRGTIVGHGRKGNIHGSVFNFKEQWYVAYHDMFPTDKFRKTCFERIHYDDKGDIEQTNPSREGVGWYNAQGKIEAEDYFEKSDDIFYVEQNTEGFYIQFDSDKSWLKFPNVKLPFDFQYHFTAKVANEAKISKIEIVLDSMDGIKAGELIVNPINSKDGWQILDTTLVSFNGTRDIFLKAGSSKDMFLKLDWFKLY